MEEGYYIVGSVVLFHIGRIAYRYYQRKQVLRAEMEISDNLWNSYLKKREILLATGAEKLGIQLTGDDETPFGVGHETHYGTQVRLLFIYSNAKIRTLNSDIARDDTLEYDEPELKAKTDSLMAMAGYYFARLARRNTTVPEPGYSRFYILTDKGIYSELSSINDIINRNSDCSELFFKVDSVLDIVIKEKPKKRKTLTVF